MFLRTLLIVHLGYQSLAFVHLGSNTRFGAANCKSSCSPQRALLLNQHGSGNEPPSKATAPCQSNKLIDDIASKGSLAAIFFSAIMPFSVIDQVEAAVLPEVTTTTTTIVAEKALPLKDQLKIYAKQAPTTGPSAPINNDPSLKGQLQRYQQQREKSVESSLSGPSDVIAKGIVKLPSKPGTFTDTDLINYPDLDTKDSAMIITAYGREGGIVAAKRIPLKGTKFPVAYQLDEENLLFPFTKEAWEKDPRYGRDIGVTVILDTDGKLATADSKNLVGFDLSKPVKIDGKTLRAAGTVELAANAPESYRDADAESFSKIDFELDKASASASAPVSKPADAKAK